MNQAYAGYANIIIDISHEKVDRPFQYGIPWNLQEVLEVGMEVEIPFGRGNTMRRGYVIELTHVCEYEPSKIKGICAIVDHKMGVESRLIQVAHYMKERYGATMITALRTVLPVKQKVNQLLKRTVTLVGTKEYAKVQLEEYLQKNQVARARVISCMLDEPVISYENLLRKAKVTRQTLLSLSDSGIVVITSEHLYRNPLPTGEVQVNHVVLSKQQQSVIDHITSERIHNPTGKYLIHGITGSGKTEVYLQLIERVIAEKKQAIVLIPEIALTYQTACRFYGRFGDRVGILNSKLSLGERYDQIQRARNGDIDVMIGPRSALFTPFERLGLIIIDEEHESSYKSEQVPRYHAREVAYYYASLHGAGVVLGSATPSVETYYQVEQGEIQLLELTKRLTGEDLPKVTISDMREELRQGNRSIFSRHLRKLLEERLEKKEQVMLFLNRRGLTGFTSCRSCGYVVKCPHCDISLSKHGNGQMMCHYCGYQEPYEKLCPSCGSPYLLEFKAGTQQVVEYLGKIFPQARVVRMDADTTNQKHQYENLLQLFEQGRADIMVGTQMIIKGHDFPKVTLVGILAADISLGANDYMASERTFQVLTQAAGRAGRGRIPGEVVIQTYQPENESIQYAKNHDYKGFYKEEIAHRKLMKYPPVSQMMGILVLAMTPERAEEIAHGIANIIKECSNPKETRIIGPTPARMKKSHDYYRYSLYIKDDVYEHLTQFKDRIESVSLTQGTKELIQYDYNPMSGY